MDTEPQKGLIITMTDRGVQIVNTGAGLTPADMFQIVGYLTRVANKLMDAEEMQQMQARSMVNSLDLRKGH